MPLWGLEFLVLIGEMYRSTFCRRFLGVEMSSTSRTLSEATGAALALRSRYRLLRHMRPRARQTINNLLQTAGPGPRAAYSQAGSIHVDRHCQPHRSTYHRQSLREIG